MKTLGMFVALFACCTDVPANYTDFYGEPPNWPPIICPCSDGKDECLDEKRVCPDCGGGE